MSGPAKRPWWVPLLGVGSIGLGGFQCLAGLLMAFAAAEVGGGAGTVFLGLAASWFLPGILLGVSGVGVVSGARWGRGLSLAAAGAMALSLVLVAVNRRPVPGAIADLMEYAERHPDAAPLVKRVRSMEGGDPVAALRDPDQAAASAWAFALECGCGLPWYLLVLAACASPSGRLLATPTPPGASRTPSP